MNLEQKILSVVGITPAPSYYHTSSLGRIVGVISNPHDFHSVVTQLKSMFGPSKPLRIINHQWRVDDAIVRMTQHKASRRMLVLVID